MKRISLLLLLLVSVSAFAKPEFHPLPGTPDALAPASQSTSSALVPQVAEPAATIAPAATNAPVPAPAPIEMPASITSNTASAPVPSQVPAAPVIPAVPATPATANAPAAPSVPALPARNLQNKAPTAAAKPAATAADNEMIPAGTIQFLNMPLEQLLDFYSSVLVHRTLLRPATLPAASITIKAQTDLSKTEAIQALDAVLGLNGIAMIPVGAKFIKVVPQAQANQEGATLSKEEAGELPELGQYITHVVQLKYSKPSELVPVLSPFAKMGPPLAIDSNGILIIRDYTENVKRMLELIEKIDVAVPSEFVSEVIPIKYALAADIQSALSSIGGGGGGGGGSTGSRPAAGARPLAGSAGGMAGAGGGTANRGYNPNNPQGTAGGTVGGAGGAAGAQATFAQRLQSIIQKAGASGSDIQLIGPNKIIADERTNSLLVFANRQDMETIKDIISKLDVVLAQVLIEAIILDVTLGNDFSLGVSAGQRSQAKGSSALGGLINNGNGQLVGGNSFLNNLVQSFVTNDVTSNVTSIFTPSTTPAYPSADGLSYFGRLNQSWDFTLSALATDQNAKILARPRIQTSHAVPASIFVGETRPYVTGTYYNGIGNGSQSQYQQTQIGISLNVLPLINTEGLVVMDIQEQVSQASAKGQGVIIDGNEVPITQDQNASAKVAVRSGETIVLGGFVRNTLGESKSGVPLLKDIPFLGALFRSTSTSDARRELLVLIRPTVLPTPEAAALQSKVERNRLPGIKQAESEFNEAQIKLMKKASKLKTADPDAQFKAAEGIQ